MASRIVSFALALSSVALAFSCDPLFSGALSVSVNGIKKPLSFTSSGALTLDLTENSPAVDVEFIPHPHHCLGITPDPTAIAGIFHLPSLNKCITVPNQADPIGPYFTGLDTCNEWVYKQQFNIFTESEGEGYTFVGKSDVEGTVFQGNCEPGLLEVVLDSSGVPVVGPDGIQLDCDGAQMYLV